MNFDFSREGSLESHAHVDNVLSSLLPDLRDRCKALLMPIMRARYFDVASGGIQLVGTEVGEKKHIVRL